MPSSVIEKSIGIARPGDVVVLSMKRGTQSLAEEIKRAVEHLQSKVPGVTFMLVDADGFDVEIKAAQQAPQGAPQ